MKYSIRKHWNKNKNKFADFIKKNSWIFKTNCKSNFVGVKFKNFENLLIFHRDLRYHTKFGPDQLSRFDIYWIKTDKQTNRLAKYIYIYRFGFSLALKNVQTYFQIILFTSSTLQYFNSDKKMKWPELSKYNLSNSKFCIERKKRKLIDY